MTPQFEPPEVIQALAVIAAFIKPFLNAFLIFELIVNFCAPPVTLMINLVIESRLRPNPFLLNIKLSRRSGGVSGPTLINFD